MKKKLTIGLSCLAFSMIALTACGTSTGGTNDATDITTSNYTTESTTEYTTVNSESLITSNSQVSEDMTNILKAGQVRSLCYFDKDNEILTVEPYVFNLTGEILNNDSNIYNNYYIPYHLDEYNEVKRNDIPNIIKNSEATDSKIIGTRNFSGKSYICVKEDFTSIDGTKIIYKIYTTDGKMIFETEDEEIKGDFNLGNDDEREKRYIGVAPKEVEKYFITKTKDQATNLTNDKFTNLYKIENDTVKKIDSAYNIRYLGDGYYIDDYANSDDELNNLLGDYKKEIKKDGKRVIDIGEGVLWGYNNNCFLIEQNQSYLLLDNKGQVLFEAPEHQIDGCYIDTINLLEGDNPNGYMLITLNNKDYTAKFHGILDKNGNWLTELKTSNEVYEIKYVYNDYFFSFYQNAGYGDCVLDKKLDKVHEFDNAFLINSLIFDDNLVYMSEKGLNSFNLSTGEEKLLYELKK